MNPMKEFYKVQAETIIKNLEKRRMDAYYSEDADSARKLALSFVKPGDTVSFGGSMTLGELGILDTLRGRDDIEMLDRASCNSPEELNDIFHKALSSDVYYMSTNAITLDGILVNTDATGNRVAALIYGPGTVVVVAGMNKVATDEDSARKRVKNIATPPNCIRLERDTPCSHTGKCGDCLGDASICSNTVITRRCTVPGRVKVILVGEELGY